MEFCLLKQTQFRCSCVAGVVGLTMPRYCFSCVAGVIRLTMPG